ncbi:MAG: phosphoribosylanthranilate isomerase [Desulfobacteraceae bacterium]|nr:phosphoribosylanthranilate isomerase [Desulfobacteraceae bacterium]
MKPNTFLLPKHRPLIKICGLTRPDNALACVHAGADAIGLVFFDKSPRNISMEKAKAITQILPEHILTCGVFVNESFAFIMERVEKCKLRAVQLHGQESPELVKKLAKENLVVIKTLFAIRKPDFSDASLYTAASFALIEYGKGTLPGGNAQSWDYGLSARHTTCLPLMLAGGLSCENIKKAICLAKPVAVDVSSGVEKAPGIKDIKKVKSFISQIKSI